MLEGRKAVEIGFDNLISFGAALEGGFEWEKIRLPLCRYLAQLDRRVLLEVVGILFVSKAEVESLLREKCRMLGNVEEISFRKWQNSQIRDGSCFVLVDLAPERAMGLTWTTRICIGGADCVI